jgi:hypothetical protein
VVLSSKKEIYNFNKKLSEYCISDCYLLRHACETFSLVIWDIGNANPFTESATIAGMCNIIFRRQYLEENKIAIIPANWYSWKSKQSLIAIKFLLSEKLRFGIKIQNAGVAGEFRTPTGHLVDVNAILNKKPTVWEYQGCIFHACKDCFRMSNKAIENDPFSTLNLRREKQKAK